MSEEKRKPTPEEKAKAAAEAKAKAEALRKQREMEQSANAAQAAEQPAESVSTATVASDATTGGEAKAEPADDLATAKAKAAAAAAAAAKAKAGGDTATAGAAEETPKAPSKNQPYLDKYVKLITEKFGADVIEDAYINELAKEVPTLIIKNESWHEVAKFLKEEAQLAFDYLSNLHGVDYEDRMEVYYHLYSYPNRQSLAVKVKTNREEPKVASVMDIWSGANWNEREAYDLLGIYFPGHTDLRRIMLPDDWVGHPLRKDYVQYDEEV